LIQVAGQSEKKTRKGIFKKQEEEFITTDKETDFKR